MPVADYVCGKCGRSFDQFFREPPEELPCECGGVATRTFEPSVVLRRRRAFAQGFAPVVVHRDAEGNIRFPGRSDAPVPAGFEKVELRTVNEVRALEREVNQRERAAQEAHHEREARAFSEMQRQLRGELRQAMAGMSNFGRDFARLAMETNDQRRSERQRVIEPGFFVEAFSLDSSNREAYRDRESGWRGRKD